MSPCYLPNCLIPIAESGSDLFELAGVTYLVVVHYYSRYPEVMKLSTTTSTSIVKALKSVFSRHGIPETAVSDNGPQYASNGFSQLMY